MWKAARRAQRRFAEAAPFFNKACKLPNPVSAYLDRGDMFLSKGTRPDRLRMQGDLPPNTKVET